MVFHFHQIINISTYKNKMSFVNDHYQILQKGPFLSQKNRHMLGLQK